MHILYLERPHPFLLVIYEKRENQSQTQKDTEIQKEKILKHS